MKDLSMTKIWIGDNPRLSEKVQLQLFKLGYCWLPGSNYVRLDRKSIFIGQTTYLSQTHDEEYFYNADYYREITADDLFEESESPKSIGQIFTSPVEWIQQVEPKVGDQVIGLESTNSRYTYTKEGSIGEVIELIQDNQIRVKFSNVPYMLGTVIVEKNILKF